MSVRMIEQKLKTYSVSSEIEEVQALREITQEVILASLVVQKALRVPSDQRNQVTIP